MKVTIGFKIAGSEFDQDIEIKESQNIKMDIIKQLDMFIADKMAAEYGVCPSCFKVKEEENLFKNKNKTMCGDCLLEWLKSKV